MIRLWPFAGRKGTVLTVKLWLLERKMVFNRPWNKQARREEYESENTH